MHDPSRADQELIAENAALKQRILDLERSDAERKQTEEALRGERETRKAAAVLERISRMASIGWWELDLAMMKMSCSLESFRINDVDPEEGLTLEQATNMVNAEARPALNAAIQAAIGK
jgi:hypothetical protein